MGCSIENACHPEIALLNHFYGCVSKTFSHRKGKIVTMFSLKWPVIWTHIQRYLTLNFNHARLSGWMIFYYETKV